MVAKEMIDAEVVVDAHMIHDTDTAKDNLTNSLMKYY
jgi:hypothetical protein